MSLKPSGQLFVRVFTLATALAVSGFVHADTSKTQTSSAKPGEPASTLPVIDVDDVRVLGSKTATLAVVEYADYECPFCRRFHNTILRQLKAEYIDKGVIRYYYKDFPLPIHAQAFNASLASFCAAQQEKKKYWLMHDKLFTLKQPLKESYFPMVASDLNLDVSRFNLCRHSARARDAINYDIQQGRSLGVNGTPAFMIGRINGNHVIIESVASETPSFEAFAREIDALRK